MESTKVLTSFMDENKLLVSSYFFITIFILILETVVISIILSRIYEAKKLDYYSIRNFMIAFISIKVGTSVKNHIYDKMVPLFTKYIKTNLYDSIIDNYKEDYKDLNLGYVLYNFTNMPIALTDLLIEFLHEYIPTTLSIIITIVFLIALDSVVGLLAVLGFALLLINLGTRSKSNIVLSKKVHKTKIRDNEHVQDKVNNLFSIYMAGTENEEKINYNDLEKTLNDVTFDHYAFYTTTSIITSIILIFITFGIFLRAKTLPNLVLILIVTSHYLSFMKMSSTQVSYFLGILGYSTQADKFINEINSNKSKLEEKPLIKEKLTGPIKFENIKYNYENNENLFNNLSLTVSKFEKIAIYGKSGTGKSTLLKLLFGFYKLDHGNISVNGINIKDINVDEMRKYMSMASQTVKIFDGTILENILYGTVQTKAGLKILYGKLLKVFKNLKNGLNTNLTVNGSTISGGQRQIISILRALLKNTSIIILDEPTVGLDEKTKIALLETIKNIKNKTVIIITHDKDVVKYVDKMYELVDGKLILRTKMPNKSHAQ